MILRHHPRSSSQTQQTHGDHLSTSSPTTRLTVPTRAIRVPQAVILTFHYQPHIHPARTSLQLMFRMRIPLILKLLWMPPFHSQEYSSVFFFAFVNFVCLVFSLPKDLLSCCHCFYYEWDFLYGTIYFNQTTIQLFLFYEIT